MSVRTPCPPPLLALGRTHRPRLRLFRHLSTTHNPHNLDNKAFTKTLLLPKTAFPLWTDPSKSEDPFRKRTTEDLYRWQWNQDRKSLFVLHDGPPYANGDLHMGHALNKILKDIIIRSQLLLGRKVNYIPGWDCHGLPIENKTLQELGTDSRSVDAATLREAANATALREVDSQKKQFWSLGVMADWDSHEATYRTLDHSYEMRQLRIFQQMVQQGLIYRHYRPVHFSPSSRSALAEAELVYKDDHVSHSAFVTFDLDSESRHCNEKLSLLLKDHLVKLLVWTTTPWTLTANMAIAVQPQLQYVAVRTKLDLPPMQALLIVAKERLQSMEEVIGEVEVVAEFLGSELVNAVYKPIFSSASQSSMRIISSSHVTSETGTGLVHCAPAHGAEDYHAFRSLGLLSSINDMVCHVDGEGNFSAEVATVVGPEFAKELQGKNVIDEGSRAVVDVLKRMGQLVKVKRFKHRYPYDWKTDKPIIVTATSQWFANLDDIKDNALNALQSVSFYPPLSRHRLEAFIQLRSEWCISRQRVWGVPIPALHHIPTDSVVLNAESLNHILRVLDEKGVAYWWTGPVEDFVPPALHAQFQAGCSDDKSIAEAWRKDTDTMDVWFDSGTSWTMLRELGLDKDEGREFLADVCLEGSDQHRGWFQSLLLTAVGSSPKENGIAKSPYRDLVTHGMVLDEKGKKMSKSLGNIISPMTIIHGGKDKKKQPAYGADVLRLWVATVEYWRDMAIGPTVLSQTAELMRKIRNSTRFLLGNLEDGAVLRNLERIPRSEMGLAERYVMHELYMLQQAALDGYATYNFPKVISALGHFANITLSSLYFDITKDCLYAASPASFERRAVATVLEQILDTMTAIYAPILPHLAEEVHAVRCSDGGSFFMKPWIPLDTEWEDHRAAQEMKELLRIRTTVLSLLEQARGDKYLKSSLEAEVDILLPDEASEELIGLVTREKIFLKALFIVSDVDVLDEGSLGTTSPKWIYIDTVSIPGEEADIAVRARPAKLDKCPRCWMYTRVTDEVLCRRCEDVVNH